MKKNILFIFIGMFIMACIGIGVYAISADQITYNDTTVDNALDDLYDKANKYNLILDNDSWDTVNSTSTIELYSNKKYKYFKVASLNKDNNVGDCYVESWSNTNSQAYKLNLNQEYAIASQTDGYNFIGISLTSRSKNNNTWSRCYIEAVLYNK